VQEDPLFEQFVAERVDGLLRYGYVLTGNPHDAADLVQEALVRLRGSWSRVRRKSALDGYVRTTMTRLHINSWRVRRREHITATPPDPPATCWRASRRSIAGVTGTAWCGSPPPRPWSC
jgi:DNA-directed RNA polymerase specialized sigma24 family protein